MKFFEDFPNWLKHLNDVNEMLATWVVYFTLNWISCLNSCSHLDLNKKKTLIISLHKSFSPNLFNNNITPMHKSFFLFFSKNKRNFWSYCMLVSNMSFVKLFVWHGYQWYFQNMYKFNCDFQYTGTQSKTLLNIHILTVSVTPLFDPFLLRFHPKSKIGATKKE